MNLPIIWIPYPDTGVQAARRNLLAVKGNGINLTKMSRERAQTLALGYAPNLGCCVVAARNHDIAVYLKTSDTSLVSNKHMFADAFL